MLQQTEGLKEWANRYLIDLATGLRVLETDIEELTKAERAKLYAALAAESFEEKYVGEKGCSIALVSSWRKAKDGTDADQQRSGGTAQG